MFTGLIEAVGEVLTFEQVPGGARLVLATSLGAELSIGESVAINGVCLTVVDHNDHAAAFDLGPETARVTALGTLAPGATVNLERAVRADARLGGHFVLGTSMASERSSTCGPRRTSPGSRQLSAGARGASC